MNNNQILLIKMANMAIGLFEANPVITELIAGLPAMVENLKLLLDEIAVQSELQNISSKGITEKTNIYKIDMIDQSVFILKEIKAYSTVNNDPGIYTGIDTTRNEMLKSTHGKAKDFAIAIYNKALDLEPGLTGYNITETVLANFKASIDLFASYMNKTKEVIIERSVATKSLNNKSKSLKKLLDDMDLLIGPFEELQPEFYSKYQSIRDIKIVRNYFTSAQITIYNGSTGNPLQGVTISCVHENNAKGNVTFVTNKYGRNRKGKLLSGNYLNTYILPGFERKTGNMSIVDNQTSVIEIKLYPL